MVVVIAKYYSSSLYSYYYSQTVDVDAEEDVANFQFEILKKRARPEVVFFFADYLSSFSNSHQSFTLVTVVGRVSFTQEVNKILRIPAFLTASQCLMESSTITSIP